MQKGGVSTHARSLMCMHVGNDIFHFRQDVQMAAILNELYWAVFCSIMLTAVLKVSKYMRDIEINELTVKRLKVYDVYHL